MLLFYIPWKNQKTFKFSDIFWGYRKATPGCNGLIYSRVIVTSLVLPDSFLFDFWLNLILIDFDFWSALQQKSCFALVCHILNPTDNPATPSANQKIKSLNKGGLQNFTNGR